MSNTGVLAPVKSPAQSLITKSLVQSPSQSRSRSVQANTAAPTARFAQTQLEWQVTQPQPGCHVIRSQAALGRLWKGQGGTGQPPTVDFERFMVLAVFAGEGCRRETLTITRIKQDETFVTVYVCAFTQRWSTLNPMHVVQIPRTEHPVQFVKLG